MIMENKSVFFGIRLTPSEIKLIRRAANRQGVRVPEIIRRLIDEHVPEMMLTKKRGK